MAESEATPVPSDQQFTENEEKKLKYLDFVQVAVAYIIVCFSTLYQYAKENSGPLTPGVQAVQGTVGTVIGPLYQKFCNVPFDILRFIDRKVDESVTELEYHVPALLKQLSRGALPAMRELASQVYHDGFIDAALSIAKTACAEYGPMARALYEKYEPIAEQHVVVAWHTLNELPLFAQVAHMVVPTAAHWAEKYNHVVADAAERGYEVFYYFPIVPLERIAKIFGANDDEPAVSNNVGYVAFSE